MRSDVLDVVVQDRTYRIEDPVFRDGLRATVSLVVADQLVASDRINLDRERDRRRFAERAGHPDLARELLLVRERVLDYLAGPPPPPRDEDASLDAETLAAGLALLDDPRLLERVRETVAALGWTPPPGGEHLPALVYLVFTSRLLERPVNLLVEGPSGAGKTLLVSTVARLFPPDATLALTGMSERGLLYLAGDLRHRVLMVTEAAGLHRDGIGAAIMRSVAWEGCVRYPTVEKDETGRLVSRLIELAGPTGLVTTTTRGVEDELATRLLSVSVPDTPEATRAVLVAIGRQANGAPPEPPDLTPWHAAQRWLERDGVRSVTIPYAEPLAELVPADLVRMRRDFPQLLNLVRAHALLYQRQRARDAQGRIVATLEDYRGVYELVAPLYGVIASGGVTDGVRQVVAAVAELCTEPDETVSLTRLVQVLGRDKSRISRHVRRAIELGLLVNLEPVKGRPAKLRPGDPLPPPVTALPEPEKLVSPLERNTATLAGNARHDAQNTVAPGGATVAQHPQHSPPTVAGVAGVLRPGEQRSFAHDDGQNADRCGVAPGGQQHIFCRCGGVLEPSDRAGWLRCRSCRQWVRADDPALRRQGGSAHGRARRTQ
jgi:hypothetical protein